MSIKEHDYKDDMDDMASAITSALKEEGNIDEFKNLAGKYFEYAQDIEKLEIALRERKKKIKFYQDKILSFMKEYQIENLETNKGRIMAVSKTSKTGLNDKFVKQKLVEFFPDKPDTVLQLMNLLNNRDKKENIKIKYEIKTIDP